MSPGFSVKRFHRILHDGVGICRTEIPRYLHRRLQWLCECAVAVAVPFSSPALFSPSPVARRLINTPQESLEQSAPQLKSWPMLDRLCVPLHYDRPRSVQPQGLPKAPARPCSRTNTVSSTRITSPVVREKMLSNASIPQSSWCESQQ